MSHEWILIIPQRGKRFSSLHLFRGNCMENRICLSDADLARSVEEKIFQMFNTCIIDATDIYPFLNQQIRHLQRMISPCIFISKKTEREKVLIFSLPWTGGKTGICARYRETCLNCWQCQRNDSILEIYHFFLDQSREENEKRKLLDISNGISGQ